MLVFYSQIPQDANSADPSKAETQIIRSLAVSPSEETLVASTEMNQLFDITLSTADLGKVYSLLYGLSILPDSDSNSDSDSDSKPKG